MNYAEFNERFGGSARSAYVHNRNWPLPEQSGLPKDFIRLDPWEIEYIYKVAEAASVGILEIGRMRGGSTFMLACAAPTIPIWSIDHQPLNDAEMLNYLIKHDIAGRENLTLIVGISQKRYKMVGQVDLLFVDGDHGYQGCRDDLFTWYDAVTPGGSIIMHDCCLEGVRQAADELLMAHPDELMPVISAHVPDAFYQTPSGSLGHFVKRHDHAA